MTTQLMVSLEQPRTLEVAANLVLVDSREAKQALHVREVAQLVPWVVLDRLARPMP